MYTLLSILCYYCSLLPQLLHHVEFNVVHDVFQNIVLMEYATFLIAYCTRELSKGTMTSKLYIVDDDAATVAESQHIFHGTIINSNPYHYRVHTMQPNIHSLTCINIFTQNYLCSMNSCA